MIHISEYVSCDKFCIVFQFTAMIRIPESVSVKDKKKKIQEIVEALDLNKCLHTGIECNNRWTFCSQHCSRLVHIFTHTKYAKHLPMFKMYAFYFSKQTPFIGRFFEF